MARLSLGPLSFICLTTGAFLTLALTLALCSPQRPPPHAHRCDVQCLHVLLLAPHCAPKLPFLGENSAPMPSPPAALYGAHAVPPPCSCHFFCFEAQPLPVPVECLEALSAAERRRLWTRAEAGGGEAYVTETKRNIEV